MNSHSSESAPQSSGDWILDREAGFGWRDEGINQRLRDLIQQREDALDTIYEARQTSGDVPDSLWEHYEQVVGAVIEQKEILGIGDPPPLPPQE